MINIGRQVIQEDGSIAFVVGAVNYKGEIVTRTKAEHPYSYDGFLLWNTSPCSEITGCVWSDRLFQWDYQLTTDLIKKLFGTQSQYFDKYSPEQLQEFLRQRLNKPNLEIVFLQEECNRATGYPVWLMGYKEPKCEGNIRKSVRPKL